MNLNRKRGVAQLFVVAVMAFLALGLPLTTKLVQQNQENRSQAAEVCKCSDSKYFTAASCSKNGGKWNCGYGPTRVPTKKPSCNERSRKCDLSSRSIYECKKGVWTMVAECINGCDTVNKKCKPEISNLTPTPRPSCNEGSRKCVLSSRSIYECKNGDWVVIAKCVNGCDNVANKCNPSTCTNGSRSCDINTRSLQECKNGAWVVIAKCVNGCDTVNGKCKPTVITPTLYPTKTPLTSVDGQCGTTINSCGGGYFSEGTDSLNSYLWKCLGKNGGVSVSCSLKKPN